MLAPPAAEVPEEVDEAESPSDSPVPAERSETNCEARLTGLGRELRVTTQSELDALEGCETFEGSLTIVTERDLDLGALRSLREVNGNLTIEAGTVTDGSPRYEREPVIDSLTGLEGLENVTGSLTLSSLKISSLSPLARFRFTAERSDLVIVNCDALESLEGLQIDAPQRLELLHNDGLATLAPLHYPSATRMVVLGNNPNLRDLSAFADLTQLSYLVLESMPLESLDAFANLRRVYEVRLLDASALVDLGMLGNLESAGVLTIEGTPATELPDLENLTSLTELVLSNNPELIAAPRLPRFRDSLDEALPPSVRILQNAKLERFEGLGALERADSIVVSGNPRLHSVRFDALTSIRSVLHIEDNAELESVSLPRLEALDLLRVVQNPSLLAASLESLRAVAHEAYIERNGEE